jgi:molybdopterin converting factor subunit 1
MASIMTVEVLYFQSLKTMTGSSRETFELPEGATVSAALDLVLDRHPDAAPLRASLLTAVNQEWAPPQTFLRPGDVLALMPPVSGG